jgi:hypothetical protein
VFIPWDRVLDLSADPEELRERQEKENKTLLAKAVFYGVRGESSHSGERQQSFPIFVILCYLLALGARNTSEEGVDKSFMYALAGQAMGVWEAYRPSHYEYTQQEQEHEGPEHEHVLGLDQDDPALGDSEDVDYVLACLMQVVCLVRGTGMKSNGVFPLVCILRLLFVSFGLNFFSSFG